MPTVPQGSPIALLSQWYEYSGGPPAGVSGLTITITPTAGGTAVVGPTGTGISNPSTGVYTYTWTVPSAQPPGDYLATWSGTDVAGSAVTASEVVSVTPAPASSAPSRPLATRADAVRFGFILPEGGEMSALAKASARLRRAAGQQITSTTSTVRLRVEDGMVVLPSPPITAVTSVVRLAEDGGAVVTGWRWDGMERIRYISAWPLASSTFYAYGYVDARRQADVNVTYTHGFVSLPDELVELVCSVAARVGAASTAAGMEAGIRSESIDDYSVTYAAEARLDAASLLPGELDQLQRILGSPPSAYVVRPK